MRKAIADAPALAGTTPVRGLTDLASAASRIIPWLALAPILSIGLFLRVYQLDGDPVTIYPDTYAQMRAIENLLSAHFPISYLYPPGIAIALAPLFVFVPLSLTTLQVTIEMAGMALILVALLTSWLVTRDRLAALFTALAVAVSGTFVFYSRVVWFDSVNLLLVVATILLAPYVTRRGATALLPYGLLVFATVTVRYTNAVLLPVLFLASFEVGSRPLNLRSAVQHLRSRQVVTVGLIIVALYAVYIATTLDSFTRFFNPKAGSVIDLHYFVPRLGRYLQASLIGYGELFRGLGIVESVALAAFAALGAHRLWRTNRAVMAPLALLLLTWAPVHALYNVFASRYAMPAFFFVLVLAGYGVSTGFEWARGLGGTAHRALALSLVTITATVVIGLQIGLTTSLLQAWPPGDGNRTDVTQSKEAAYDQIRDVLRDLDGSRTTLLSTQVLALDRSNSAMATYDLIRHSETYGINADSNQQLLSYVRDQQASGRTVYYHYTEFEDLEEEFQKYEAGYDAYFRALRDEFSLREVVRATERQQQRLYVIEPVADPS
ncbi:MAG: hypothetical protein WEE64_04210 [Dehalococcoidia bacterium]